MIDDLVAARPQSGLQRASVVWQAPAEGGIPRYMLIFQDDHPRRASGPVRSARYYYIAWAAEWRAVYAHAGGSPQALATLRAKGSGQLVYNADEFRWGRLVLPGHGPAVRAAQPVHDGQDAAQPRQAQSARRTGRTSRPGQFAPDAPLDARPTAGRSTVAYPANKIRYNYDRKTNTYLRSVTGEKKQIDAATGKRVAPKNVVVMLMRFGPLNDGHPNKHRLEADVVGSGTAWIATNGTTIKGTWKKTVAHEADALLRRGRQAGHADRRPDVRPGHADGLRRSRSRPARPPPPATPSPERRRSPAG